MAGKQWVLMEKDKTHENCGWYVHRKGWGYTRNIKTARKYKTRADARAEALGETPVCVVIP